MKLKDLLQSFWYSFQFYAHCFPCYKSLSKLWFVEALSCMGDSKSIWCYISSHFCLVFCLFPRCFGGGEDTERRSKLPFNLLQDCSSKVCLNHLIWISSSTCVLQGEEVSSLFFPLPTTWQKKNKNKKLTHLRSFFTTKHCRTICDWKKSKKQTNKKNTCIDTKAEFYFK